MWLQFTLKVIFIIFCEISWMPLVLFLSWYYSRTYGVYFRRVHYVFFLIGKCLFQYCEKSVKKDKSVTRVSFAIFVWIFDFFFRENLTQKMRFFSPGSINLSPATWYSLVIVTIWKLVSNLMSLSFDLYDYAWSFFRGI